MTSAPASRRNASRRCAAVAAGAGTLLAAGYALRLGWLFMMASEGDRPPACALQLPTGARVEATEVVCASGGCWTELTVLPAPGRTAAELAAELGATPQARIGGDLVDPRTTWVWAEPHGRVLVVRLDYFSQPYAP